MPRKPPVILPYGDFTSEHKNLTALLGKTGKKLLKEANEQKAELRQVQSRGGASFLEKVRAALRKRRMRGGRAQFSQLDKYPPVLKQYLAEPLKYNPTLKPMETINQAENPCNKPIPAEAQATFPSGATSAGRFARYKAESEWRRNNLPGCKEFADNAGAKRQKDNDDRYDEWISTEMYARLAAEAPSFDVRLLIVPGTEPQGDVNDPLYTGQVAMEIDPWPYPEPIKPTSAQQTEMENLRKKSQEQRDGYYAISYGDRQNARRAEQRRKNQEEYDNSFFGKIVNGLTKVADFAVDYVAPVIGVPGVVTGAYKHFAPPGSKFYRDPYASTPPEPGTGGVPGTISPEQEARQQRQSTGMGKPKCEKCMLRVRVKGMVGAALLRKEGKKYVITTDGGVVVHSTENHQDAIDFLNKELKKEKARREEAASKASPPRVTRDLLPPDGHEIVHPAPRKHEVRPAFRKLNFGEGMCGGVLTSAEEARFQEVLALIERYRAAARTIKPDNMPKRMLTGPNLAQFDKLNREITALSQEASRLRAKREEAAPAPPPPRDAREDVRRALDTQGEMSPPIDMTKPWAHLPLAPDSVRRAFGEDVYRPAGSAKPAFQYSAAVLAMEAGPARRAAMARERAKVAHAKVKAGPKMEKLPKGTPMNFLEHLEKVLKSGKSFEDYKLKTKGKRDVYDIGFRGAWLKDKAKLAAFNKQFKVLKLLASGKLSMPPGEKGEADLEKLIQQYEAFEGEAVGQGGVRPRSATEESTTSAAGAEEDETPEDFAHRQARARREMECKKIAEAFGRRTPGACRLEARKPKGGVRPDATYKTPSGKVMSGAELIKARQEWERKTREAEGKKLSREETAAIYSTLRDLMDAVYYVPKPATKAPPPAKARPSRGPGDAKVIARVRQLMSEGMTQLPAERQAMKEYAEGKL